MHYLHCILGAGRRKASIHAGFQVLPYRMGCKGSRVRIPPPRPLISGLFRFSASAQAAVLTGPMMQRSAASLSHQHISTIQTPSEYFSVLPARGRAFNTRCILPPDFRRYLSPLFIAITHVSLRREGCASQVGI